MYTSYAVVGGQGASTRYIHGAYVTLGALQIQVFCRER